MSSDYLTGAHAAGLDARQTPRALRAKWTGQMLKPDVLKSDLAASLTSYEDFADAVRRDIKAITNSGIPIMNLRAAKYMRRWGLKKFRDIFAAMLNSLMGAGFDRWRGVVVGEKKAERMEAYLKYQGGRRMGLFLRNFILKYVAAAWVRWLELMERARAEEEERMRDKAARLLQMHYRGHEARVAMKALREVLRKERREKAALRIQSWCVREKKQREKIMSVCARARCLFVCLFFSSSSADLTTDLSPSFLSFLSSNIHRALLPHPPPPLPPPPTGTRGAARGGRTTRWYGPKP